MNYARIGVRGLIALSIVGLMTVSAPATEYKLEFIENNGRDDFKGTLSFKNVKKAVNTPASCEGILTVGDERYELIGTHWWPQNSGGSQASRFYSVTLADEDKKVYLSLLLSFNKVSETGDHRWGIAGQALMPEKGDRDDPREEWLVIGRLSK